MAIYSMHHQEQQEWGGGAPGRASQRFSASERRSPASGREDGRWEPTMLYMNSSRVGKKRLEEVPASDHPPGSTPGRLGMHDKEKPGCSGHGPPTQFLLA